MRNFLMKFFLDQTVCSVMNVLLFIVLINLLKGASWSVVWEAIGKVCYAPIILLERDTQEKENCWGMNIH